MLTVAVSGFRRLSSIDDCRTSGEDWAGVGIRFPMVFEQLPVGAVDLRAEPGVEGGELVRIAVRVAVRIPSVDEHDELLRGRREPGLLAIRCRGIHAGRKVEIAEEHDVQVRTGRWRPGVLSEGDRSLREGAIRRIPHRVRWELSVRRKWRPVQVIGAAREEEILRAIGKRSSGAGGEIQRDGVLILLVLPDAPPAMAVAANRKVVQVREAVSERGAIPMRRMINRASRSGKRDQHSHQREEQSQA